MIMKYQDAIIDWPMGIFLCPDRILFQDGRPMVLKQLYGCVEGIASIAADRVVTTVYIVVVDIHLG